MRKTSYVLAILFYVLILSSCNNKNGEKLVGIWQLQLMDVNGSKLQGNSLGNWLWEFNEEGGYLADIGGAREKGRYDFKGNTLKLQAVTSKDKPAQLYTVTNIDSVHLDLVSTEVNSKAALHFVKIQAGQVGEKD